MTTRFSPSQILAYHLTKNYVFQAKTNRSVYLRSLKQPHPATSYENEARMQASVLDREMTAVEESGTKMLFLSEKNFPSSLSAIPDAPVMLFVRSKDNEDVFDTRRRFVTVVGTRNPDIYGTELTKRIVRSFAPKAESVTVVSGLAIGIDTHAHMQAVDNGIPTVAVLPCSVDTVYPNCNARLGATLTEREGCALVSPFAPNTPPAPVNFLLRNRVVAALGDVTVAVQSKAKGGTMVTARLASDYGRRVYAVPGRIGDNRSEGCNRLIWEGTAEIFPGDGDDAAKFLL